MLSVFKMSEWKSVTVRSTAPSERDQTLATARGRDGPGVLTIDWLLGPSVRITASSWVGVARFDAFEVQVVPKLVGGESRVVEMIEYASGLDRIETPPGERDFSVGEPSL